MTAHIGRALCGAIAAGFFLSLADGGGAVLAQETGGGLILLPDDDGLTPLVQDDPPTLNADRIDPARRSIDTATENATLDWVSPLRLTNMQIPVTGRNARISGERQVVGFDLYVSAPDTHRQLQLATQSSIDLLPERSSMRVHVNGQDIGVARLGNFDGYAADFLDIPDGVLRVGRNQVQIEFRQGHRIFCGPEASFGLWTDIDLAQSGLSVNHADAVADADGFMMAFAAQVASGHSAEIRGLDKLGPQAAEWRRHLVRGFNQALLGSPVVFRFSDYWTLAQQDRALARITVLPASSGRVSYQIGGDGAHVMVLEIGPDTRPEDILTMAQLAPQPAASRAPLIQPEQDVPLSAFGVQTESFSQRYARRDHPFRLPDDWLVLTAAKARLNFDYIYATGLPRESMLLISMNDEAIRLLPLRDEGGQHISQFPIDFEARILQPGTNRLTFELMVPGDPPDLPCPAADHAFLQISDTSTLHVPYSPSMAIPDMDLAFGALTPDSIRLNEMSGRAYSDADIVTLSAALDRSQAEIRAATLHLISLDDLGSVPSAHHRADRRLLEDSVLSIPAAGDAVTDPALASNDDPFQRRRQQGSGFSIGVSRAISNGWGVITGTVIWVKDRIFPNSGEQLNQWLAARHGQAILFHLDPARPDEIWMLRSPDSDIHAIAHAIAAARISGAGPRGQVSILSHQGAWQNWVAPDRRPILLEPWSLRNFRHAMGNLVSARPIFFTLMILFLALLSAVIALRLVISTRDTKT
ncbi:cellulose biosynthesis cyclic di-GMP-binding regulatory protein BcsB [Roseinatronobacter alkalisoli]|uniref:Cyclic di-GMP-binding protein n=1 Tax=Roseinatronobacter alkalisoli TaxID=3028235 RepID=A0ABT5T3S7_9RHOB|nr:cellulose biosynthesis cyclic di-GMP-binding regulatory protein BcsB [Roseinatronobacter sp. HJB301]MDD7969779.1 cellulose biosynthesis cyclic di-GMP-binding regulatory protein BcsB [Roseinatronobacter sp. HJB301]